MSFISDLIINVSAFRVKIGEKLITLSNRIGNLPSLTTTNKTSLVSAINEVNGNIPMMSNYVGVATNNQIVYNNKKFQSLQVLAETVTNITQGWNKIATLTGRGYVEVVFQTTGGSQTPVNHAIKICAGWSNATWNIDVDRNGTSSYIRQARIVREDNITYLEVDFTSAIATSRLGKSYLKGYHDLELTFITPTSVTALVGDLYCQSFSNTQGQTIESTRFRATNFIKDGGTNNEVLLAGGSSKPISDFVSDSTQTLISSAVTPGYVGISDGNNIVLQDLFSNSKQDGNSRILNNGFKPYRTVSGQGLTNYPSTVMGTGFRIERFSSATAQMGFDIYNADGQDYLWYKTFRGEATENPWKILADRDWVNANNYYSSGNQGLPNKDSAYLVFPKQYSGAAENFDWNNVVEQAGFYKNLFNSGSASTFNAPRDSYYGFSENSNYGGNLLQIARPYRVQDGMYMRSRFSNIWTSWYKFYTTFDFNINNYVLQTSLNTQLGNYATKAGTQIFTGQNTFTVTPIVPNGTLDGHTVNLGQLNTLLVAKADVRLSNLVSDLSTTEKATIKNKLGVIDTTYTNGTGLDLTNNEFSLAIAIQNTISKGLTAYGWGNHASAGYALSSQLANYVPVNGAFTINGTKTFSSSPVVPNAALSSHAVNLGQVYNIVNNVIISNDIVELDLLITDEFQSILDNIPQIGIEYAKCYYRNKTLGIAIKMTNSSPSPVDVFGSSSSIVSLFTLPDEIMYRINQSIRELIPQFKLQNSDPVSSYSSYQTFVELEGTIKHPYGLLLSENYKTVIYGEFECLDMV